MKKVNWNLEEIESFSGITDEELIKTSGGEDKSYDAIMWMLSLLPVVGPAIGLMQLSTITAHAPTIDELSSHC